MHICVTVEEMKWFLQLLFCLGPTIWVGKALRLFSGMRERMVKQLAIFSPFVGALRTSMGPAFLSGMRRKLKQYMSWGFFP